MGLRPKEALEDLVEETCHRSCVKEQLQLDADTEGEGALVGACNRAASAHLLECTPTIHLKNKCLVYGVRAGGW